MNTKKSQKAQEEISKNILQSLISGQQLGGDGASQSGQKEEGSFENFVHMMRNSSNQSGRFKKLLQELKSNDPVRMMQGVIQLSQELSMAQENTLHHFQADAFIPQLVECLKQEAMPDTIYFSMISLTQIMDILPNSCNTVVNCGGVKIFVEKIQHIEYIDVAEQAIKGLQKISTENPHSIIAAGGLSTMLNLVQFFDNTVQRKVIKICARISQNVSNQIEFKEHAASALPALTNLIRLQKNPGELSKFMLQNVASILVKLAQTIIKITDQVKNFPNILALYTLFQNAGIYEPIMKVLNQCLPHLSSLSLYSLLKVLSLSCKASFQITSQVVNIGLVQLISQILTFQLQKQVQETLVVSQTLYLLDAVLPDYVALKERYSKKSKNIKPILPKHVMSPPTPPQGATNPPAVLSNNDCPPQKIKRQKDKLQLFSVNDFALLQYIAQNTMSHLLHLYEDSASGQLRLAAIMAVQKMVIFANGDMLATCSAFKPHKIAHLMFSVFESKNVTMIQLAIEIVNLLLLKAEGLYLSFFEREGVTQTIKSLKQSQQSVFTFFGNIRPKLTTPAEVAEKQKMLKQRKASVDDKQKSIQKQSSQEQDTNMQSIKKLFNQQFMEQASMQAFEKKIVKKIKETEQSDINVQGIQKKKNELQSFISKITTQISQDDKILLEAKNQLGILEDKFSQLNALRQDPLQYLFQDEQYVKDKKELKKIPSKFKKQTISSAKDQIESKKQQQSQQQQQQEQQQEQEELQQQEVNQYSSYDSDISMEKIFKSNKNENPVLNQNQVGNKFPYYSPPPPGSMPYCVGGYGGGGGGGSGGYSGYLYHQYIQSPSKNDESQDISTNYILLKRYDMIYQTAQEICFQYLENDEWLLKSKSARKQSSTTAFEKYVTLKNVSEQIFKIAESFQSQTNLIDYLQQLKPLCENLKQMTNYQFMNSGLIDALDALLCSTPSLIKAETTLKNQEEQKDALRKNLQAQQSKEQILSVPGSNSYSQLKANKKPARCFKQVSEQECQVVLKRMQIFFSVLCSENQNKVSPLPSLIQILHQNMSLANQLSNKKQFGNKAMSVLSGSVPLELDTFSPVNSLRQLTRRVKVILIYQSDHKLIKEPIKLSQKLDIFMKKHVTANIGGGGGGRPKPSAYSTGRWGQFQGFGDNTLDRYQNEVSRIQQGLLKKQIFLKKIKLERQKAQKGGMKDQVMKLKRLEQELFIRLQKSHLRLDQLTDRMMKRKEKSKLRKKSLNQSGDNKKQNQKEEQQQQQDDEKENEEQEEKDPFNASQTLIFPFSLQQCSTLSIITDFLFSRVKTIEQLEKLKVNQNGVIEFNQNYALGQIGTFNPQNGLPSYAMNNSDLIDQLSDRVLNIQASVSQFQKNEIMAEIEDNGLSPHVLPNEDDMDDDQGLNPQNLSFDQISAASRILDRIRMTENQIHSIKLIKEKSQQSDDNKKKTIRKQQSISENLKELKEKDYDELKKSNNQKKGRKIKKFSYYANGKRVSDRSTVYQLLKNPIQFKRIMAAGLVLHFKCKTEQQCSKKSQNQGEDHKAQQIDDLQISSSSSKINTPESSTSSLSSSSSSLSSSVTVISHPTFSARQFLRDFIQQKLYLGSFNSSRFIKILRLLKFLQATLCDGEYSQNFHRYINSLSQMVNQAMPITIATSLKIANMNHNPKITSAVHRQLQDPFSLIADQIPPYLKSLCTSMKLLISFSTRHLFFRLTALGVERSIYFLSQYLKSKYGSIPQEAKAGKSQRQKTRVSRDEIVECGLKIMKNYHHSNTFLEFEYKDEVGSGLGPTLQFYTLSASSLRSLNYLWRKDTRNNDLFPAPLEQANKMIGSSKALNLYQLCGFLVAKCIVDDRIIDLPLSPLFWRKVRKERLFLQDICEIDQQLGDFLLKLRNIALKKEKIIRQVCKKHGVTINQKIQSHNKQFTYAKLTKIAQKQLDSRIDNELRFTNSNGSSCKIQDLSLSFTLPGYDQIELVPQGRTKILSAYNIEKYLERITRLTLYKTIDEQISAFRKGFKMLINYKSLSTFSANEIEWIYCGNADEEKEWSKQNLISNILPQHGYTSNSQTFKFFIQYLSTGLSKEKRKVFLKFITGSPRLPLGGFASLTPKLQVVERVSPFGTNSNDYLPSVMTCQNFLKMPRYDNYNSLKEKFDHAIEHTVEFDLA